MSETKVFAIGTAVKHETFGKGVITAKDNVELPSDNDHTMYTVKMEDGELRHFKGYELK